MDASALVPPPDRNALLIRAAETALLDERRDLASQALRKIDDARLDPVQQLRMDLVLHSLGQLPGGPEDWLLRLPPPSKNSDAEFAQRLWAARADIYLRLGEVIEAVHALVQREHWLKGGEAHARNQAKIWNALNTAPAVNTPSHSRSDLDEVTLGWLELAQLQRAVWTDSADREHSLDAWEKRYPRHPARDSVLDLVRGDSSIMATRYTLETQPGESTSISGPSQALPVPPATVTMVGTGTVKTLALILPLSGSLSTAAQAVRDGFMASWFEQPKPRPRVLVFDSGSGGDSALAVYERALASGADMVVGPLSKDAVSSLARMITPSQPLLALNYLEPGQPAPANFFQFGLAPEDEAQQVARRALADGHRRAVALVPEGDWGSRALSAFQSSFELQGGKLLDFQTFPSDLKDFSEPVRKLLKLEDSERRKQALGAALGQDLAFTGSPGSLPDFVFIAAQPQQGRLIRPQFRFLGAGQIPLYATSLIYEGTTSSSRDADLDDILFCDMPFLLGSGNQANPREKLRSLWPDIHGRHPRLYAFGYDAATLALRLARGGEREFGGVTGQLRVNEDGRVHRGLLWARFQNGRPRPLEGTGPPL